MRYDFDIWNKHTYVCGCGKIHTMPIQSIVICPGALEFLKTAPVKYNLGRKALIVIDRVIFDIIGKTLEETLQASFCVTDFIIFENVPLLPDENALTKVLLEYTREVDFFIAAGSGAVNDITRYYSFKMNKPYISVPTAASMDGYSAKVSLLFIDGLKQTYEATYPFAIYADTNILSKAPMSLMASGCGDLFAKLSACCDWKIAGIVNGEYFCEPTYEKIMQAVDACFENLHPLVKKEPEAVQLLMEGLMISGIAMHWMNSSCPAAGAEHHLTHFWGMQHGAPAGLHGLECAVGTILMGKLYRYLLNYDFTYTDTEKEAGRLSDKAKWRSQVEEIFKEKKDVIFSQNRNKPFDKSMIAARIQKIKENEKDIKNIIRIHVQKIQYVSTMLEMFHYPPDASAFGLDGGLIKNSLLYAKEVRSKYTVLDMFDDLGILEEAVNGID